MLASGSWIVGVWPQRRDGICHPKWGQDARGVLDSRWVEAEAVDEGGAPFDGVHLEAGLAPGVEVPVV